MTERVMDLVRIDVRVLVVSQSDLKEERKEAKKEGKKEAVKRILELVDDEATRKKIKTIEEDDDHPSVLA